MVNLQIPRPQRNRFGDALGNNSRFNARETAERNRGAIMSVKALRFDQGCAVEPEAALSTMLSGSFEHTFSEHSRLCTGIGISRRWKDPNFAVGKNAVNVEKNEFNFARTGSG